MALRKQNAENILLQEGTICSALLLQEEVVICDGGTDALVLTGAAPVLHYMGEVATPLGTLSLSGSAPTLAYDWVTFPSLGTVALTGITPTAQVDDPCLTSLGTATLTGKSVSAQVDDPCLTSVGSVTLAGNAIEVNVANSGTSITNPNASTTRVVNINACEYSGFQAKPHELKPTHNAMVLPEFWEDEIKDRRYPRRTATATGPLRAEPVGDEVFLAVNEVSADNL